MGPKTIVAEVLIAAAALAGCSSGGPAGPVGTAVQRRLAQYETVRLTADVSRLEEHERRLLPLLVDAARAMDDAFWLQAFGNRGPLLESISDPDARRLVEWNYGPWDRLDGNAPFLSDFGPKPPGAGFYPVSMTREEFEQTLADLPEAAEALRSQYTLVRRNPAGQLVARPFHEAFAEQVEVAAGKLRAAAVLARDPGLRRYLELRAEALLTDEYRESDLAWLDMRDNRIDIVIGPIETLEDQLFGQKAAYEAFVLIRDQEWSAALARFATLLPALQAGLPVPDPYKQEPAGSDAELNAYDVVYYAGDGNAGSKTIAINLPNDEQVQLERGTRRLQLKNAMRAKFDAILGRIVDVLVAEGQRGQVTFDAFFANTMFHEVAHGLGIKHTITGRGTVREALLEQAAAIEEGKADVLGLHMVTRLVDAGEVTETTLEQHYVTFLADTFRSVRFGAASAHGTANMIRFNFFREAGALVRDETSGTYRVEVERMRVAIDQLAELLLRLQGDGDHDAARRFVERMARIDEQLSRDLARLAAASIPVDVVFEQGLEVLGR